MTVSLTLVDENKAAIGVVNVVPDCESLPKVGETLTFKGKGPYLVVKIHHDITQDIMRRYGTSIKTSLTLRKL